MFENIGISEFVLIAIVALVLFGPDKLPEIGRKLGNGIREFRSGYRSLIEEVTRDPDVRAAERRAAQQAAPPQAPAAAAEPAPTDPAAPARPGQPGAAVQRRRAPDPRRLPD